MKATAPAKIILSGEHAVLYGAPAIAMAINRYIETEISVCNDTGKNFSKPSELASQTVMAFLNRYNIKLSHGLSIEMESIIQMGCGLGSSAALITSTLRALYDIFDITFTQDEFLSFATDIEDFVHGKSSGLDIHVCALGGVIKYQNYKSEKISLPEFSFTLVHTGIPKSTTKDCVAHVRSKFQNKQLVNEFAKATELFLNDLEQGTCQQHDLLNQIGVVPDKVKQFINEINLPAKICGAGSVDGDAAGMLLVISDNDISSLCKTYGYSIMPVHIENKGVL